MSRSRNGIRWQAPVSSIRSEVLDKNWIACDNWPGSPHRGSCYLTVLDIELDAIVMRTSRDGGRTWSRSVVVAHGGSADQGINGAQPLVRPNGTVLVVFTSLAGYPTVNGNHIATARSTDGGASFEPQRSVASIEGQAFFIYGVRAPQFLSGDVDAGGTVYLSWHDCPEYECDGNEIRFARSADGSNWTTPQSLPVSPGTDERGRLLPAPRRRPGTRGTRAQVAVAYYSMRCLDYLTAVSMPFSCGRETEVERGGLPERLNPKTMKLEWLADTNLGRMVGDYISTSFVGLRPIPVLALASAPSGGRFNEAIFASRLSAR